MPLISYLKIMQFVLFLLGLYFVARVLQQSPKSLYQLRCAMMALSIIMLVGSLVVKFVPAIGYSMYNGPIEDYGLDTKISELLLSGQMMLFNGMACHSQALPPVVSILGAWVLCDMLMVERKVSPLHVACLVCTPILLFLSRSRGGLLELIAVIATVFLVCMPKLRIAHIVKSRLATTFFFAVFALVVVAFVAQIRNGTMSRWLRKTDDVGGDNRSLADAFTGSRQMLIDYNLNDFHRNPLLGMGFQVMAGMKQAYQAGMITWYSASVEKGVTPFVIIGETGIVGAVVFMIFLISFYATCLRKRYLSLLTSFTCVLVANLADSTLFSPGGGGGLQWIVSCIGAFSTDILAKRMNERCLPMPFPMEMPAALPPPYRKGWRVGRLEGWKVERLKG